MGIYTFSIHSCALPRTKTYFLGMDGRAMGSAAKNTGKHGDPLSGTSEPPIRVALFSRSAGMFKLNIPYHSTSFFST